MVQNRKMIKILLADDHPILRDGLKLILEQEEDLNVVGLAQDGIEAFETAKKLNPDIAVIDICMGAESGIKATKLIKEYNPSIKVLTLTTFDNPELINDALEAGIDGYILKAVSDEYIKNAIRSICAGINVFDEKAMQNIRNISAERKNGSRFTPREMMIIKMIAEGKTNRQIAIELKLKEGTIKNIVSLILSKAAVSARSQLVAYAAKNKLNDFENL